MLYIQELLTLVHQALEPLFTQIQTATQWLSSRAPCNRWSCGWCSGACACASCRLPANPPAHSALPRTASGHTSGKGTRRCHVPGSENVAMPWARGQLTAQPAGVAAMLPP